MLVTFALSHPYLTPMFECKKDITLDYNLCNCPYIKIITFTEEHLIGGQLNIFQ